MKTIKLSTGVTITHDKHGNIKTLSSPYFKDEYKETILQAYVNRIRKIIR